MLEFEEFRVADRNSEAAGVPVSQLMENAGAQLAQELLSQFQDRSHAVFFCGSGNNGGDGFVAARIVSARKDTAVITASAERPPAGSLLEEKFSLISRLVRDDTYTETVAAADTVIVDCLLGSGIDRPPAGRYLELIRKINDMHSRGAAVVAADVPSGFPFPEHVIPDVTVTFMDTKAGMNEHNSGRIRIADIGIPEKALTYTGPGEMLLFPIPKATSHKGNNGIVTVIGGSVFPGAPVFSSLAAYRTGADLVYTLVPGRMHDIVSSFSPNIMAFACGKDEFSEAGIRAGMNWVERSGAVVIGPGTLFDSFDSVATRLIGEISKPMVIDASAIETVGRRNELLHGKRSVVTPHAVEFFKLTGEKLDDDIDSRKEAVRKWAGRLGTTILLKGRIDIISDGERIKLNGTGNAGMTVGGTGDVLTGIVAALMAKGLSPFNAARLGAYINGSAGDICFGRKSYGLLATDVIEAVPEVLASTLGESR
jgi:hydroxyethylthiazole kinase-like uncharacterized protein yjeF